jgi:hypothetical protein
VVDASWCFSFLSLTGSQLKGSNWTGTLSPLSPKIMLFSTYGLTAILELDYFEGITISQTPPQRDRRRVKYY